MEKVWFKLRQTHYPPPPEASILQGCRGAEAPICLGHVIKDLKNLDFVLNPDAIEPFTPDMRVFRTLMIDFQWDDSTSRTRGGGAGGSAPVATAVGLTLGGHVKVEFKKSIGNHEEYERLDTYIVQPTQPYVEDCLDENVLVSHIERKAQWSLFMITGLCVARRGKRTMTESHSKAIELDGSADIPGIAGADANITIADQKSSSTEGTHSGDFVWAIRLAKIHKGVLSRDWSLTSYTKRATFDTRGEDVNVAETISGEGMNARVVEDKDLGCALVV